MSTFQDLIDETIASGNIEDPFYVVNIEDIIQKHQNWLIKMPRIQPFYAVKCNNSPIVIEILAALGLGFDCASKAEIDCVLDAGVQPSNIIYANPCKSKPYIQYADKTGVNLMTFDNEEELHKIAHLFPEARLVLRIKADDSHSKYHLGQKFGADVRKRVPKLLELAKNLGLRVVGVSFHVGSGCDSADVYRDAVADARKVFDAASAMGFEMTLLDIGGGFPGGSDPSEKQLFDDISKVVNDVVDLHFPPESGVTLIAEPGRYYVASAFTLTALVIAKRDEVTADGQKLMMYYINDGLYGSFSNTTFGEEEVVPFPHIGDLELKRREWTPAIIWGPTCDALDCLRKRIVLPELEIGEWMTFKDMGAYTLAIATRFNGFQLPLVKCHASPLALEVMSHLSAWPRLVELLRIREQSVHKSLVDHIWDFIHVQ